MTTTRCDLHLHSRASIETEEWYSKHFGCPESYATPQAQYELCKARGMSLVTLTDHDTIAGGLELVDRPDFFLSEEITARFPENDCVIHVLAWNITPAQHARLQAARPSVYDIVDVLRRERIAHACAHPLLSPNWRLDADTLEKILVLFPTLELANGLTDRRIENDLRDLVATLDPATLAHLAGRHGLTAATSQHRFSAGSDDHARRRSATCFTEVGTHGLGAGEFLEGVMAGAGQACGHQADLTTMQVTVSHTTYHFLAARGRETPGYQDPFADLIDVVTGRQRGDGLPGSSRSDFVHSLLAGAAKSAKPLILPPEALEAAAVEASEPGEGGGEPPFGHTGDAKVMADIGRLHDVLLATGIDEVVAGVCDVDMYRMLGGLRDVVGALCTSLPFLFAADHFGKQHRQARRVLGEWRATTLPPRRSRMAMFSDSIENVDGVTRSLGRFAEQARAKGCEVRIPYCGERPTYVADGDDSYQALARAATYDTSLYKGMRFHLPSLLGTVDWLWREEITHVDLATPGPMGMIGLLAARLLRLPVTASYHTAVPELIGELSAAPLRPIASKIVGWFYGAVDRVFAFSELSRRRLIDLGVSSQRIDVMSMPIDPDEFSPDHAHQGVFAELGIELDGRPVVLSVGRLSREKNLPVVIEAVTRVQQSIDPPPILVVVGDGPERGALEASCADKPFVRFVGMQHGDTLRRLYASADVFAFASEIDTLGLVNLEAMASGLPVLVPRAAAVADLVGETHSGLCYPLGVEGLASALSETMACSVRRAEMSARARQAIVDRWRDVRFDDVWGAMAVAGTGPRVVRSGAERAA